ncbi:MAG: hypothetical protein IKM13_10290 [Clostridia bacterium]|nr:hypothetical protein [Clostridia bacterium]
MKIHPSIYKKEEARFDPEAFRNPGVDYAPFYSWVWNGVLTREEILRQLDEMGRLGIRAMYVIPEPKHFRPNTMPTELEPDYLTEAYFEEFRFAMEEAAKRGMKLWLYDEGGWPSGGACGRVLLEHPELARRSLAKRAVQYAAGTTYTMENPVVAAFEEKTTPIGTGHVFEADTWVEEYWSEPHDSRGTTSDYPDLLIPESNDAFIACTHEGYKPHLSHLFGGAMEAVFTDEPKAPDKPFRKELAETFEKTYGYSLLPYLPYIMEEALPDERAEQALIDYYELASDLFCQNFFLKGKAWSNQNGLAFTGHVDKDDEITGAYTGQHFQTLRALRCLDIPGVDVIWRQIWKNKHDLSAKYDFFPRMASSAATQVGSGRSLTESFGVYGPGLNYEEMRYTLGAQAIRGVNLWNLMVISYGREEHHMTGELPSFGEMTYPDLAEMNRYMERLSYLAAVGRAENQTALYLSTHDLHVPTLRQAAEEAFVALGNRMEEAGVSFDIFDDDILENADPDGVKSGKILVGKACYTTLVIPRAKKMPQGSKERLSAFIAGGGRVYTAEELPDVMGAMPFATMPLCFDSRVDTEKGILCQKRILENGTLLLFWNKTMDLKEVTWKGTERAYRVDVNLGELHAMQESLTLYSGETGAILVTDETLPVKAEASPGELLPLGGFTLRKTRRFAIGDHHFVNEAVEEDAKPVSVGDWQTVMGADFTGDGVYETSFAAPGEGGVILDLGEVASACEVFLNGKSLGVRLMAPWRYEIGMETLLPINHLAIRVTNNPANAYLGTDAFDKMEHWTLSPYHDREMEFCRESLAGGILGPVTLWQKK